MAVNYSTIGIICLSVNLHWHALCGIVKASVSLGYFKLLRTTDKKSFLKYWMTETPTNCKRGGHPMSFQDKSIQCSDCGDTFTFSAEDQEFFQSKGYTNEPKRCLSCRQARKSERYSNSSYGAPPGKCSPQPALSAARAPKSLFSLAVISQFIIAIAKLEERKLRNRIVNVVEALPLSDKGGTASNIRVNRLNRKRERRQIVS